jgi:hypothetical protein
MLTVPSPRSHCGNNVGAHGRAPQLLPGGSGVTGERPSRAQKRERRARYLGASRASFITGPSRPEERCNHKTFRGSCIGSTCRAFGPKGSRGETGRNQKDDFLSVLDAGDKKAGERAGAASTSIPAGTAQDGTRRTGPSPGGMARVAVRTRWEAVERLVVIPG